MQNIISKTKTQSSNSCKKLRLFINNLTYLDVTMKITVGHSIIANINIPNILSSSYKGIPWVYLYKQVGKSALTRAIVD